MIGRQIRAMCCLLGVVLLLGACSGNEERPQDVRRVQLNEFRSLHAVRFETGNIVISPAEAERLLGFVRRIAPRERDKILVEYPKRVDAKGTELRRAEIVAKFLAKHGYLSETFSLDEQAPDLVRVSVSRLVARAPEGCPDWSPLNYQQNVANGLGSNLGCATSQNFAAMIADPHDIREGRSGGTTTTSDPAVLGQERYRQGQTKEFLEGTIVGIGGGS